MDDSSNKSDRKLRTASQLVHGGGMRSEFGETSEAIFLTSGYVYPDAETAQARLAGDEPGFVYSRYANPTVKMLEDRLSIIEGAAACRATASGMAAIHAALVAPVKSGDRVVAARALFGSCTWILDNLLPRYGVEVEFVDGYDLEGWKRALSRTVKSVLIETPSNPLLDAVDISAVADLTHAAGGELIVDNVFATPILQRPLELGADWVTYSCTKHMDGQGRVLGGAILGKDAEAMEEVFAGYLKHTGPAISPFNAWTILKGLETLALRVDKMCDNARIVADFLAAQPSVRAVRYPGRKDHPHFDIHSRQMSSGGSLISFSIEGGKDAAFRVLNSLELVSISNNLGDAKSLICHPATTTHRTLTDEQRAMIGLDQSWVRLSVGLEDAADVCDDLERALSTLR